MVTTETNSPSGAMPGTTTPTCEPNAGSDQLDFSLDPFTSGIFTIFITIIALLKRFGKWI
jgi:hypothetical protein